jgi:hypothetical protein
MATSFKFGDKVEREHADKLRNLRNLSMGRYIRLLIQQDWARHGDKAEEHAAIARRLEGE